MFFHLIVKNFVSLILQRLFSPKIYIEPTLNDFMSWQVNAKTYGIWAKSYSNHGQRKARKFHFIDLYCLVKSCKKEFSVIIKYSFLCFFHCIMFDRVKKIREFDLPFVQQNHKKSEKSKNNEWQWKQSWPISTYRSEERYQSNSGFFFGHVDYLETELLSIKASWRFSQSTLITDSKQNQLPSIISNLTQEK